MADADVLVYTGYPLVKVAGHLERMAGQIDALITDPYLVDAPQTLALRGSDNQRLHCLTPLGQARFGSIRAALAGQVALDIMFDDDGSVWFAGIPRREDWARLQRRLASLSTKVTTSIDASIHVGRSMES